MSIALFAAGLLVVALVFFDALWTSLWPEGGAGPLTDRVGNIGWELARRASARKGRLSHRRLSAAGPMIVILSIGVWFTLLTAGLVVMIASHPEAVVDSSTEEHAGFVERIWFALSALSTMGNGEFKPGTGVFQIVTGLAALGGISLLTLVFAYLIQVLQAVVQKRTFAGQVASLGESAIGIAHTLSRARPEGISTQLPPLGNRLNAMTEQHKAFPILHYFHPTERIRSAACAVASLDEALRVYRAGLDDQQAELAASTLVPVQRSIETFLQSLRGDYFERAEETPPIPPAARLERDGIEIVHPDTLVETFDERSDHRRLMRAFIDHNGWHWDEVLYGEEGG